MNNKKIALTTVFFAIAFGFFTYFVKCSNSSSAFYNLSNLNNKKNLVPVLIIGSGPAGNAASLYTARIGYDTIVLKGDLPGGQLTQTSYIENWPGEKKILGNTLMNNLEAQATSFGVKFISDKAVKADLAVWPFKVELSDGTVLNALTIIIATGATPKILKIPGEQEYWGKGVTTCAICDARFYQGRDVVVIGGGDSAAEEAIQLSAYANSIEILVRKDKMRASKAMLDHLAKIPNIKISYNKEVKKIKGDNKHVNAIEIYDNKTKTTQEKSIEGVFLAIGHEPNTTIFKGQIDLDSNGYIVLRDRSQTTSMLGVAAAGDNSDNKYRQAGVAAGDGIKAALDIASFLASIGVDFDFAKKLKPDQYDPSKKTNIEIESIKNKFQFDVMKNKNKVVIADFYGTFCPPCKAMLPVFEQLSAQFVDKIKFVKVNTEENDDLVMEYRVSRIPCFVVLKDGKEVERKYGLMDKTKMANWLETFLK